MELSERYGEHVDFVCTGHGGPYALSLAKFLLDNNVDIEENAKHIAYTILWVAEEVDTTVGGLPDVLIIKDRKEPVKDIREVVEKLDEDSIRKIMKKIKEDKRRLPFPRTVLLYAFLFRCGTVSLVPPRLSIIESWVVIEPNSMRPPSPTHP